MGPGINGAGLASDGTGRYRNLGVGEWKRGRHGPNPEVEKVSMASLRVRGEMNHDTGQMRKLMAGVRLVKQERWIEFGEAGGAGHLAYRVGGGFGGCGLLVRFELGRKTFVDTVVVAVV